MWHFKCQRMRVKAKICLVFISFLLLLMLPAAEVLQGKRSSQALISSSGGFDTQKPLGMYILDNLQLGLCVTVTKKGADGNSERE